MITCLGWKVPKCFDSWYQREKESNADSCFFYCRFLKPFLTNSRPNLMETCPGCCRGLAQWLTTQEQMMEVREEVYSSTHSNRGKTVEELWVLLNIGTNRALHIHPSRWQLQRKHYKEFCFWQKAAFCVNQVFNSALFKIKSVYCQNQL